MMHRGTLPVSLLCLATLAACTGNSTRPVAVLPPPAPLTQVERSEIRERALSYLVQAASDPDAQTRANAIESLMLAPARLFPLLPAALSDTNLGVRSVACVAAGKLRWCEQPALLHALLGDSSDFVRASAMFALARCDESTDLTPLASLLFGAPRVGLRSHTAFLLGEIGNPSALPMLRQASSARIPRASEVELRLLQLQIAEAMFKLGDDSQLPTLHGALFVARPEDLEATVLATQILGQIGSRKSAPDLVNLLAWKDETGSQMPAEVRLAAAAALGQIGVPETTSGRPETVALQYMESSTPAIRAQAAAVFGYCGGNASISALLRLWKDPDPQVRVAAAGALVRILSP